MAAVRFPMYIGMAPIISRVMDRQSKARKTGTTMTTYVGIDFGTKRIGLAIGSDETGIASPLKTVASCGNLHADAMAVADFAKAYEVDAFVVGLPLNMDDTEGPQSKLVRKFGSALAAATDKSVHFFDERLSSVEAEELIRPAELTRKRKKARLDRVAAQVILQEFLAGHRDD